MSTEHRVERVVVFGAAGQDGPYLREAYERRGAEVVGFSRSTSPACDVSDFAAVEAAVKNARPDVVFQLAADSRTAHDALFDNHAAIAGGAANVLEAVHRHAPEACVVLASSGLVFENRGAPIDETRPFEAKSPYAAARIYATYLARYYRDVLGRRAKVAYFFHHESPRRSARHTSMRVALAAARAAAGSKERLRIGDPSVEKEWTYAGDVAEALVTLAASDVVHECVIGSGVGHTIEDWLRVSFAHVGLDHRDYVDVEAGFVPEYRRMVSNPARLLATGWTPTVGFSELSRMMIEAATERLGSGDR